jgi:4-amino-4-deoxy-L-arabinose transferase-like glycosyltransferase
MFTAQWGGQISWLIPAALIAIVVMLWVSRRAARTDRTRAAAILWGGWLVVAGLVLSFMSGTTHSYYAIALAPPIGALIGIGAVTAWRIRRTWFARAALAAALAVTAAWAWILLGRNPGWYPWLRVVIVIAAVGAAGLILAGPAAWPTVGRRRRGQPGRGRGRRLRRRRWRGRPWRWIHRRGADQRVGPGPLQGGDRRRHDGLQPHHPDRELVTGEGWDPVPQVMPRRFAGDGDMPGEVGLGGLRGQAGAGGCPFSPGSLGRRLPDPPVAVGRGLLERRWLAGVRRQGVPGPVRQ